MWVVRGGLMGRSPRGLHTPWGKVWEVKSMGLHSTPGHAQPPCLGVEASGDMRRYRGWGKICMGQVHPPQKGPGPYL